MRTRNHVRVTGLGLAALLALAACSTGDGATPEPTDDVTAATQDGGVISLVLGVAGNPYYETLACGAKEEAEAAGYSVTVAAPSNFAAPEQIPLLNGVVSSAPDGAIVAPTDPQALGDPMSDLIATGAKVVTVDTTLADPSGLTTQILTDNEEGGRLAAETLSELIGGAGQVMVIQGPQGNIVESARRTGFEDKIAEYPDIEYVGVQYAENDPQRAAQFITSTLASSPDLAGVFATNDLGSIGVITGLEQAGATGVVDVVAFDAASPQVNALKNGTIDALIAQQPAEMGRQAVRAVIAAINGSAPEETTYVPSVALRAGDDETADTYEYKADC